MANYIANVLKLRGRENYNDWAFAAKNFLMLDGLIKYISDSATDADEAEDAKAKAKLILTIDTSLYIHIKEAKNTKELWNKVDVRRYGFR